MYARAAAAEAARAAARCGSEDLLDGTIEGSALKVIRHLDSIPLRTGQSATDEVPSSDRGRPSGHPLQTSAHQRAQHF